MSSFNSCSRNLSGVGASLSFWRRKAKLVLLLVWAGDRVQPSLAFGFLGITRNIHVVAFASSPRFPRWCRQEECRRRRARRMVLRAEYAEDDYARLVRRMNRLERIVSEQNTEMEVLRSSMDEMRAIIQIQAQIDAFLVEGGEEGLLSARLEAMARGEPDSRLVRQAIKLLRMRQGLLQAWEFQETPDDVDDDVEIMDQTGESLASEFSTVRGLMGLPPSLSDDQAERRTGPSSSDNGDDDDDDDDDDGRVGGNDSRYDGREGMAYGMYNPLLDGRWGDGEEEDEDEEEESALGFRSRFAQRPPKTNQDAADAAGAGVVAALMEGRRRLIVDVDDAQLRYNSPDFCYEAMAEFLELLVLPLTTALENLNAEQNRCKIVIQGANHMADAKKAMVLDAPDSLQVVSLEDAKVAKKDRVVALVAPENWTGKKGKHLKRVLAEAHDAAIILVNPTGADKFLRPADYNTFELVYHLHPMRVNYLQPLPPPHYPPPPLPAGDVVPGDVGGESTAMATTASENPTGEALLLESLGESIWAEEKALAAGVTASDAAAIAKAAAAAAVDEDGGSGGGGGGGAASAETLSLDDIEVRAAEQALARAALEMRGKDWTSGLDIGYRDREWEEEQEEGWMSGEGAGAFGDGGRGERERWGEGQLGEWAGGDEAAEMSALAVTLRQYPDAWEAFVDLHDGMGFRLCGTWDLAPPPSAVKTVVMDHILRIVMD